MNIIHINMSPQEAKNIIEKNFNHVRELTTEEIQENRDVVKEFGDEFCQCMYRHLATIRLAKRDASPLIKIIKNKKRKIYYFIYISAFGRAISPIIIILLSMLISFGISYLIFVK